MVHLNNSPDHIARQPDRDDAGGLLAPARAVALCAMPAGMGAAWHGGSARMAGNALPASVHERQ
jgi:hypothetical protein